ncbi:MAG TPA: transglutaminaseTgpA domain-containing protein [Actinocrinis sp.]|nr:transglutaminaseTgpA domain-containing protein [Actinocrinis sp.]
MTTANGPFEPGGPDGAGTSGGRGRGRAGRRGSAGDRRGDTLPERGTTGTTGRSGRSGRGRTIPERSGYTRPPVPRRPAADPVQESPARRAGERRARAQARMASRRGLGVDGAFTVLLGAGVLAGLHTTYGGWWFLVVGLLGLALGASLSLLANALRLPVLSLAAAVATVFFLVGPALLDRPDAIGGALPSLPALRAVAKASVLSWKQLLTTAPPVAASGILLTIPLVLGLAAGAAGLTAARRLDAAAAPLAVPVVLLGTVIALGTHQPGQWTLTGVLVAAACLAWAALRSSRHRAGANPAGAAAATTAGSGAAGGVLRKVTAAGVVLVIAVGGGLLLSPMLPGGNGAGRSVLRDTVVPPLNLNAYPSPLVGFRKYTKDANQLYDQTLFTVAGLPAGTPVRIATLDDYDGSVWGATNGSGSNGFDRVGSSITPAGTLTGPAATATITIAPAYAEAVDTDAWLPTAGTPTGVTFDGTAGPQLAGQFRYNAATDSGLVLTRLQAGDKITVQTVLTPDTPGADAQPYGPPTLTDGFQAEFASRSAAWAKGAVGIDAQLAAIETYLKTNGAYTDGGKGESQYLPGHSIGRLTQFLNGPQPVGDDEQYAAAFALIANSLGMPARVVLGAVPEADGTVKGQDVHAWVEIHTADGAWDMIPTSKFTPPPTKTPDQQPPQPIQNAGAAVVPPPNAVHPPGNTEETGATAATAQPPRKTAPQALPSWIGPLLRVVGLALSPLALVLLVVGVIQGLKMRRRRRRRTRGSTANRYAAGWRDLVDHARDLGTTVPWDTTRQQQNEALAAFSLGPIAQSVDVVVYGPGDPTPEQAAAFWKQVDQARKDMSRAGSRKRRLLATVDVRTLLRARSTTSRKATAAALAAQAAAAAPQSSGAASGRP